MSNKVLLSYEPDRTYDRLCEEQDQLLYERMHTIKCGQCLNSVDPSESIDSYISREFSGKICWCLEHDEFCDPDKYAYEYDCEEVDE